MHVGNLQPTANDLRNILGLGSEEDDTSALSAKVPLLLFPCADAEFIEVTSQRNTDQQMRFELTTRLLSEPNMPMLEIGKRE